MARDAETKEIGGYAFTVRPLDGMRSARLMVRLNKALGPAIAKLAGGQGKFSFDALGDALAQLGDRLPEAEFESLAKALLEGTSYLSLDGTPGGELLPRLGHVTQGAPETLFQLLAFALEVNYRGFFPALRGLAQKAGASPSAASTT